jgi:hypothetical protein
VALFILDCVCGCILFGLGVWLCSCAELLKWPTSFLLSANLIWSIHQVYCFQIIVAVRTSILHRHALVPVAVILSNSYMRKILNPHHKDTTSRGLMVTLDSRAIRVPPVATWRSDLLLQPPNTQLSLLPVTQKNSKRQVKKKS